MKPLFKCEIEYVSSPHLNQLYAGFELLKKRGIIDFTLKSNTSKNNDNPLLYVKINNKYTIVYDTLDGLNWIKGTIQENLEYFKNNIKADYYFKRSFNNKVVEYAPDNCKVYPLGLNYNISNKLSPINTKDSFKNFIKDISFLLKFLKVDKNFFYEDFEFYPVVHAENHILFSTRIFDPEDVKFEHMVDEIEVINKKRIKYVKLCKKEFGKQFKGGIREDNFSLRKCRELTVPFSLTKKDIFLDTLKKTNICVSTTGLHGSINWKFGEYVSASRGIISEPLNYEVPGLFEDKKNYFSFSNENEFVDRIDLLLRNKDILTEMMKKNYHYYNNYLRPDILLLNTFLIISQNENNFF